MTDTNIPADIDLDEEIITITWTARDIESFVEMFAEDDNEDAPTMEEAIERARSWASAITDTANTLIGEQLSSVVRYDTP